MQSSLSDKKVLVVAVKLEASEPSNESKHHNIFQVSYKQTLPKQEYHI